MIVKLLRSKDTFRQVLIHLLIACSALIPAYFMGITIHIPEDSSVPYLLLANMMAGLNEPIKLLIFCIMFLWLVISLAKFSRVAHGTSARLTIPAFFSILLLLMLPENISFHPLLFSMLLLIPAIREILVIGTLKNPSFAIFNAGFLLSMASLFSYPVLLFAPLFLITLFVFRLYKWNYMAILATGMVAPWFYFFMLCWVFGWWPGPDLQTLHYVYSEKFSAFYDEAFSSLKAFHYPVILLMSILVVVSAIRAYARLDQHIVVKRSLFKALLWILLPVLALISLSGTLVLQNLIAAAFFSVIVLTAYLQNVKRARFADILLIMLVLSVIAGHIYPLIT